MYRNQRRFHNSCSKFGKQRLPYADFYCQTLKRLQRAIQNQRCGMLSRKVLLVHDNTRPHTAHVIQALLKSFNWEIFNHPKHTRNLAPSDYWTFPKLKCEQGSRQFASVEELQEYVHSFFANSAADFYE